MAPLAAAMGGGLLFVIIYGWGILDPTNVSWLANQGDLTQHYLGWEFFRQSEWSMPIGRIGDLAYPSGTSIVYMDAIPIAAIFFKSIQFILPATFQYFGWWGLISFMLQASLAALILKRFTSSTVHSVLGSMLVVLAPTLMARMFQHTALASQWVILLAILLVVYRSTYMYSWWKSILIWSGMFVLAVGIHPYFVIMVGAFFASYLILTYRGALLTAAHVVVAVGATAGFFWLIGGTVAKNVATVNLGMYGADLNSLFNPIGYSYFLRSLPTIPGAYEGMAFLGLGVYILALMALGSIIFSRPISLRLSSKNFKSFASKHSRKIFACLPIIGIFLLAVGPVVYANGHQILVLTLPTPIAESLSVFRSTGRFTWAVSYLAMLLAVILVIRLKGGSRWGVTLVMSAALMVQFIDVSRATPVRQRVGMVRHSQVQKNPYDTKVIERLFEGKQHAVYTQYTFPGTEFFNLGEIIVERDMTINNGYISRKTDSLVKNSVEASSRELGMMQLRNDTVYITSDSLDVQKAMRSPDRPSIVSVRQGEWLIATKHEP